MYPKQYSNKGQVGQRQVDKPLNTSTDLCIECEGIYKSHGGLGKVGIGTICD